MGSYQLKTSIYIFLLSLMFWTACNPTPDVSKPDIKTSNAMLVINEGNYTWQNSELSIINIDSGSIQNNIYEQINNEKLGDVAQSACITDNYVFVVVNNSGKIVKIDRKTLEKVDEISGLISPRYMLLKGNEAFVSDLYAGEISVLDMETFSLKATIKSPKSTEAMLLLENELYVCHWSQGDALYVLDLATRQFSDTIPLISEPESMVLDKNNQIWVLCSGGYLHEEFPALFQINPETKEVSNKWTFSSKDYSTKALRINPSGDTLYFVHGSVYQMSIASVKLPIQPLIGVKKGQVFYGLDIDTDNTIWLSNAGNFVEASEVFHYQSNGQLIKSYLAGVNAVHFHRL